MNKTIHYTFINNNFYRENIKLDEKQVEKEIGHFRFLKLRREGKCNVRSNNIDSKDFTGQTLSKREQKLLNEKKNLYKTEIGNYKSGIKFELWRKSKYGYYNFVEYIENLNEDTIETAILKDIDKLNLLKKTKG